MVLPIIVGGIQIWKYFSETLAGTETNPTTTDGVAGNDDHTEAILSEGNPATSNGAVGNDEPVEPIEMERESAPKILYMPPEEPFQSPQKVQTETSVSSPLDGVEGSEDAIQPMASPQAGTETNPTTSDGEMENDEPRELTVPAGTETSPTTSDGAVGNEEHMELTVPVQCKTDPTGSDKAVLYEEETHHKISIPCEANPTGSDGAVADEDQDYPITPQAGDLVSSVVRSNDDGKEMVPEKNSQEEEERACGDSSSDGASRWFLEWLTDCLSDYVTQRGPEAVGYLTNEILGDCVIQVLQVSMGLALHHCIRKSRSQHLRKTGPKPRGPGKSRVRNTGQLMFCQCKIVRWLWKAR